MNHDLIIQLCHDLNGAHTDILVAQGFAPSVVEQLDWPKDSIQAYSIRQAEKTVGKKLAKTNNWTVFPEAGPRAET